MNLDFLNILGDAPAGAPGMGMTLVTWLLVLAGFWFLMIAPQRKKQKKHEQMVASLGTGDEVMTNAGIYGTISNVKEDRFIVKIGEGVKIEVNKNFVQAKIEK